MDEVVERLTVDQRQNQRRAELLTVHFHPEESQTSLSRSIPLRTLVPAQLVRSAWDAMCRGQTRVVRNSALRW